MDNRHLGKSARMSGLLSRVHPALEGGTGARHLGEPVTIVAPQQHHRLLPDSFEPVPRSRIDRIARGRVKIPVTPLKMLFFMESSMRIFGAAILAASLVATNAFAATTLPAGKPAGVKKAQWENNNALLIISAVGLAGLGIGLAASTCCGNTVATTTTTIGTVTP
jgi:hypothetical protein